VQVLKLTTEILRRNYNLTDSEIMRLIAPESVLEASITKESIEIPIETFSSKLGILESVVKYLKENLNLRNSEISKILSRSGKTIWSSYNASLKKNPSKLRVLKESRIRIPISIFSSKELGALESLVLYLNKRGFSVSEISSMLGRNYKTIYSTLNNAFKKTKPKNEKDKENAK
jgi:DNA-binding CsgD family transcriptional regulator